MARRRSSPRRVKSSGRRYRPKTFVATCVVCQTQVELPVQPPVGIELTCPDCIAKATVR